MLKYQNDVIHLSIHHVLLPGIERPAQNTERLAMSSSRKLPAGSWPTTESGKTPREEEILLTKRQKTVS